MSQLLTMKVSSIAGVSRRVPWAWLVALCLGVLTPVSQAAEPVIEIRMVVDEATSGAVRLDAKRPEGGAKNGAAPVKKISVAPEPLLKGDEIEIIDYYPSPDTSDGVPPKGMGMYIGFPREVEKRVSQALFGESYKSNLVVLIDGVVSSDFGMNFL